MWSRSDLKNFSRGRLAANYWIMVLAAIIMSIAIGNTTTVNYKQSIKNIKNQNFGNVFSSNTIDRIGDDISDIAGAVTGGKSNFSFDFAGDLFIFPIAIIALVFAFIFSAFSICIAIFLLNPLAVGGSRFFLENHYTNVGIDRFGFAFRNGYKNVAVIMFLKGLYTFLWSLLFVIPGIIKSYEYRLIPYILADNPEMSCEDAFELSKRMMDGNKFDAFILDLSFIGWEILNIFTVGLLGVFFIRPYIYQTNAELYIALKTIYNYNQQQTYDNYVEMV